MKLQFRWNILRSGAKGTCPSCGSHDLFHDRYRMHAQCPQCGLPLEKEDGWAFGAVPLNYSLTCIAWVLPVALMVFPGWLSVKTAAILAGGGVLILPWLTYRYSKKVWLGLYYAILPQEMNPSREDHEGDVH